MDLLQDLYAAADPPMDWRALVAEAKLHHAKTGEPLPGRFYLEHYLSEEDITRIMDGFRRKHRLTKRQMAQFSTDLLSYAPTSIRQEATL